MSEATPFLSVIVPAYRGTAALRQSLPALLASDLPRSQWELLVVDDTSGDETPAVAGEYADVVVPLEGGPWGPGYARNRGVEASRGEVVVFVDADVCVHADTLRLLADAFRTDPGLAAVFGSYDDAPPAPGLVSRFRNLLHHHVHQLNAGPAETFWAGCGAVRRDIMLAVGLFDAWHFPRPQIEDIELGRRLRRAGHRIALRPDIQGTHLKRWNLRDMLVTDFRDRGVPWMWLLLSEGRSGGSTTLNLRFKDRLCTAALAVIGLCLLAAVWTWSAAPLALAGAAALLVVLLNRPFYTLLIRTQGFAFAFASVPLHLLFYFNGGLAAVAGMVLFYTRRVPGLQPRTEVDRAGAWPPADCPPDGIWTLADTDRHADRRATTAGS